jgi:hypothetical protein
VHAADTLLANEPRQTNGMLVVLSWSGEKSRTVARALWEWLPRVLYFVDPWMSDRDIHAGQRWEREVAAAMNEAGFGILCVTRESVNAPWLIYEAGALSRTPVAPLLIDIPATLITGPLAQFQAKTLDRQGCHDLVISINARFGSLMQRAEIDRRFDERWPELAARVAAHPPEPRPEPAPSPREREVTPALPASTAYTAPWFIIPLDAIRRAAAEARNTTSLRHVADEVGMSAMGLRAFIGGEGMPQARTVRKLNMWYVRSQVPSAPDTGPLQPESLLRERAAQAVEETSLRTVAREIGISPMGLQHFVSGGRAYRGMLGKVNLWYLRSVYPDCWTPGKGWDLSGAGPDDARGHDTDDEKNGREE